MSVEYSKFDNFEKFNEDFFGIVGVLFKSYKDVQVNRIGLRYINNINLDEQNPTDWNGYLTTTYFLFSMCHLVWIR